MNTNRVAEHVGRWLHVAAKLALALIAAEAAAQTHAPKSRAALDQVTVTTTRIESRIDDVPATVSVISRETIERQLAQDIKDLIRFEPGVAVRSSPARFTAAGSSTGRDGNSGFNIRGLEGNRVLMQIDGIRTPDGYSFGPQAVGRGDYVDLGLLESVEIVRGPASALYGSDGLAGSVSFITRNPEDLLTGDQRWSLRTRAAYGSADDSFSKSIVGASALGNVQMLFAYTRRDGEGQETQGTNDAGNADRTTSNPEDNESEALLAKIVYSPNDANRLRLTWDRQNRNVEWDVLSAVAKPPLTATSTLGLIATDDLERDRLTLDHRFESETGAIRSAQTAVYYQDSHTRQLSVEDRNTAADRTRDSTFDNTVRGATLQLMSELATGRIGHRLVYGADYSVTRQESLRHGTVPPTGETFPTHAFPNTDHTLAGVFVQDEITFGRVSLFPAVRWDHYRIDPENDPLFVGAVPAEQEDSHVTPKLGLIVHLTDEVNVFANAAAGFKAPAPSQVNNGFANPIINYRSISNPDLKPETSETVEAGVRFTGSRWSGSVTAFTGRYDDFIEQILISGDFTPTNPGVFQFVNLTEARIHGAEGRANVELGAGFTVDLAASWSRGESETDGVETPLPSIEPFKLVSGLRWHTPDERFEAQLYATFSDSKSASRAGVACTPDCFIPESFTVLDLLASWDVTDAFTVRAGVFNVTDEKYWWWSDVRDLSSASLVKDAFSQPGRNASVSMTLRF